MPVQQSSENKKTDSKDSAIRQQISKQDQKILNWKIKMLNRNLGAAREIEFPIYGKTRTTNKNELSKPTMFEK